MKKILVIEDEVKIAQLAKKALEAAHFRVDLAHDGKTGLLMAEKGYDLIILDIMLPGLNGFEVCRTLRYQKINTPIIILTARDTIEDRLAATDAGADDYLSKPYSFESLLSKVQFLLEKKTNKSKISAMEKLILTKFKAEDFKESEINKRIIDNVPVSIIIIDKDGNVTWANKYFKNLSKWEDYQNNNVLTGKFFIRENLVKDYKKLLSDGTILKRDHCFEKNINGEDKYLKIIAVPLLDKKGNIEGAISMALDNTESILLQNKLRLLNEELEKKVYQRTEQLDDANKEIAKILELKSMFVADVSHEMRTSLAIIQGNVELLTRGLVNEEDKQETYEQVFQEIKGMSMMLEDMAILSDSKSAKQKFNFNKIDLNQIISNICNSLKAVAKEKNIKITHKNNKTAVAIIADQLQIEKMVMNLIRNAIKYNKENGNIIISVQKNLNETILEIKDTGVGISQEDLPYIFERFYRVDKSRSRGDSGSGLGLAICKWVAEIHGGSIDVKSIFGEGSIFTVKLPQNLQ